MASELLKRAQRELLIQDVYVREATAATQSDFDPVASAMISGFAINVQMRVAAQTPVQTFVLATPQGNKLHIGYIVDTGIRVLKQGVDINTQDPAADAVIAEITAKFVARYEVIGDQQPSEEMAQAFADNAIHHVWPYWREFLQATSARLRLPPIVLPMRVSPGVAPQVEPAPVESKA